MNSGVGTWIGDWAWSPPDRVDGSDSRKPITAEPSQETFSRVGPCLRSQLLATRMFLWGY
jgi:hypothetical protein